MGTRARDKLTLSAAAVALVVTVSLAPPSDGQVVDDASTTTEPEADPTTTVAPTSTTTTTTSTTTTTTATSTTTTAPPAPLPPGGSSQPAPEGATTPPEGDGEAPPPGRGTGSVPAEAQRVIDGVRRTPPNGSADLLAAVEQLVDLGLTRDEAIRIGFGRFPVAGAARYSHDWLYPRWGPGFRYHLGTDVFAAFGTPLRAPVDGVVRSGTGSLGGLYVKIFMDDGTYFYFAHLSGLVDGFVDGMRVQTGDIVGYVGDSGNAKGTSPHLHIGIHPKGGDPTDPKPILDRFLADATARLPEIVEAVRASRASASPPPAEPVTAPSPDSLLAGASRTPWTRVDRDHAVSTEILYQTTGNPTAGGVSVARAEAEWLAARIDWDAWATRSAARAELLRRTEAAFRSALGPIAGH